MKLIFLQFNDELNDQKPPKNVTFEVTAAEMVKDVKELRAILEEIEAEKQVWSLLHENYFFNEQYALRQRILREELSRIYYVVLPVNGACRKKHHLQEERNFEFQRAHFYLEFAAKMGLVYVGWRLLTRRW